jgi:hypothetical protein
MKTVIDKKSGKVLFAVRYFEDTETEIGIDEVLTENFVVSYFNQQKREFYEGATQDEVNIATNQLRTENIKSAYEQRKSDGWDAYQSFRANMVKEIYDEIITKQQAFIIEDYLSKGYDKIAQQGDWETAYYKLSTTVIPDTYSFVQSYLDSAKAIMLNYIQTNYKPM